MCVWVCIQELEPEIESLCSQLLSRLDANVEEIQQMLVDTSSQEVIDSFSLLTALDRNIKQLVQSVRPSVCLSVCFHSIF